MTSRLFRENPDCRCDELGGGCIRELLPTQAWALYELGIVKGLLGPIDVGHGKCHAEGAEFLDYATGRRRDVSESGALETASLDEGNIVLRNAQAFPSGEKECVTVTLADGCSAIPSNDHPYLTHRGWVKASELVPGSDFVAVACGIPEPSVPTKATDSEVEMIALLLSDGGCSRATARFFNETPSVLKLFKRLATELCDGWRLAETRRRCEHLRLLGSRPFRDKWDLYGLAKEKRMHASLWGLPKDQVSLLLNRFWACDGHVSAQGVELTLASEKLLDDIRFLLLRLGVRTRKHYKKSSNVHKGERKDFDAWRISLYGKSALDFLDQVGPVLGKEKACATLRKRLEGLQRNANKDVVPVGPREVSIICDELGIPRRSPPGLRPRSEVKAFFKQTGGQFVSREKFRQFVKERGYRGRYAHLAMGDVAWERVKSVIRVGIKPVYDLNVPGTENFLANGMVVHNTGLDILAAIVVGAPLSLLLCPAKLVSQFKDHYELWSQHWRVPSLVILGGDYVSIEDPDHTLHVMSYARLSHEQSAVLLEENDYDFVFADEVDALRNPKATRTRRLMRFMGNKLTRRFAGWTGSMTDASIKDYAHLSFAALRDGSPLPIDTCVLDDWAGAIDPGDDRGPPGELMKLCNPGETIESGFHRRLVDSLGVVATDSPAINAKLVLQRRGVEVPSDIEDALRGVRDRWERPDGDDIVDRLSLAKCLREVACGFYYYWHFPRIDGEPQTKDNIEAWLEARKSWRKELRSKLDGGREFMDSPLLCTRAAMRAWGDTKEMSIEDARAAVIRNLDEEITEAELSKRAKALRDKTNSLPRWKAEHWPRWRDLKESVVYETRTEHINDFLARDAAEWGLANSGVIWYTSTALGDWIAKLSGLSQHGGGPNAGKDIAKFIRKHRDKPNPPSIVASARSHGTGRDGLQYLYSNQLITQPASSATASQQWLGRLHRIGQEAPVVRGEIYAHTLEVQSAIDAALHKAEYVESTIGSRQKITAGWSGFYD